LAEELERQHPELVVSAMAKTVRARKVFIDWSQNSDFKTTVAVYSLRAKRERPYISMPFTWEELRRAMKKKDAAALYLEPEAALKRLQNVGDLFAPVLEFKQSLPSSTDRPKRTAPRTGSHATPTPAVNFVEPMRAKLSVVLPEGPEWLHEIFLPI
jgi:bifunctional non-homologous end joining protein LigD